MNDVKHRPVEHGERAGNECLASAIERSAPTTEAVADVLAHE
jgi:hypothetical protein